jgi:uncharacterized protein (DUF697 family)
MKKKLPKAITTSVHYEPEPFIEPVPEPRLETSDANEAAPTSREAMPQAARAVPTPTGPMPMFEFSETDRHEALKLVERFALWAGAAGAIPLPGLDLAGVGAVQLQMVRRLAEMFEVEFSRNRGKALVAAIGGAMITGSSGLGAASLTKTIPVLGPTVSSVAVPTLAAGATYAIGIAFIEHFASGGTLLNFDLQRVRTARRKTK